MHQFAVGVAGGVDVKNGVLAIDVHLYQLNGVLGEVAVLGDHDGDRVADIADVVLGETVLGRIWCVGHAAQRCLVHQRVDIGGRVHGSYAGRRPGRLDVETGDATTGHFTAQKSRVRATGHHDIRDVA